MKSQFITGAAFLGLSLGLGAQAQERTCSTCMPRNDGDFMHREDMFTPGWIGHAGIKLTPRNGTQSHIYDVNAGRPKGSALQAASLETFIAKQTFWGAKRSGRMDLRRVNMMSSRLYALLKMKTEYDGNHLNQKGEALAYPDGVLYFEADCVGFVEGLHEFTRDDLTPAGEEGKILTVQKQRDRSFSFEVGR